MFLTSQSNPQIKCAYDNLAAALYGAYMVKRNQIERGFSLIELLIVVAIILIIAAISIPNLLRSRMAANEASAVGSIRTINVAAIEYQSTYGVFPAALPRSELQQARPLAATMLSSSMLCSRAEIRVVTLTLVPGTQAFPSASCRRDCTPGFSDGYVVIANPRALEPPGSEPSALTQPGSSERIQPARPLYSSAV